MALHPDREIIAKLALYIEENGGLEAVGLDRDQLLLIDRTVDNYLDNLVGAPVTIRRIACDADEIAAALMPGGAR